MRFRPLSRLEKLTDFNLGLAPQALCFHALRGFHYPLDQVFLMNVGHQDRTTPTWLSGLQRQLRPNSDLINSVLGAIMELMF